MSRYISLARKVFRPCSVGFRITCQIQATQMFPVVRHFGSDSGSGDHRRLRQEVELLRQEVEVLTADSVFYRKTVAKLTADREYSRLISAFQDLNSLKELEQMPVFTISSKSFMKSLRSDRTDEAHYIYTRGYKVDSQEVINYKLYKLTEVVTHMSPDVVHRFKVRQYGPLLSEIRAYLTGLALSDNRSAVDPDEAQEVDDWWIWEK